MKTKVMVLSCLIGAVVLSAGYERTLAKAKETPAGPKIGIVSVVKIFRDCKKNEKYRQEVVAERNKVAAELEKLSKEIEAENAGLKTLKPGSSDYSAQMKEVLTKQGSLQAQQEFHNQQMAMKEQKWTEDIYKEILRITVEVAQEKGLDLVLGKDEIEFPTSSANELMLTISTNKVLYSGGCLDITDEVMARLDTED